MNNHGRNNHGRGYQDIKAKAMAAGTSPRLAIQRINAGWNEDDAIHKESRTKRLRSEEDLKRIAVAPSFLPVRLKVPAPSTTPMPKARPGTMAKALEASKKYGWAKADGENKYTKRIREVIEGKL